MIFNRLEEARRLHVLHPGFAAAFAFLSRHDLKTLAIGTHEIDGRNVYALVQKGTGQGRDSARLEIHEQYIDIQYTMEGFEWIGCGHRDRHELDSGGWNTERDIGFFTGAPDFWLPVPAGSFALFFPGEDLHAPMSGEGDVRKVVVKVRAAAL